MITSLLLEFASARSLQRIANGLQKTTDWTARQVVRSMTRPRGVPSQFDAGSLYSSGGAAHGSCSNTYGDRRLIGRPQVAVMRSVNDFAHNVPGEWRRTGAGSRQLPSGQHMVFLVYEARVSFNVELAPVTAAARINENLKQGQPGYDWCIESVPYHYRCRIELVAEDGQQTGVSYKTTERIAPFGGVRRDIRKHYTAPAMPDGFGMIGAVLLASL